MKETIYKRKRTDEPLYSNLNTTGRIFIAVAVCLTIAYHLFNGISFFHKTVLLALNLLAVILLACVLCEKRARMQILRPEGAKPLTIFIMSMLFFTTTTYLLHFESISHLIWGTKEMYGNYIFFFAGIAFLKVRDIEISLTIVRIMFYVCFCFATVEYCMGYGQDRCGGIFGIQMGCNQPLNLFMIIFSIITVVGFLYKKEKWYVLMLDLFMLSLLAAMAELKAYFVEIILVVFVSVLFAPYVRNKIITVLLMAVADITGIILTVRFFPHTANAFVPDGFVHEVTHESGYTSSGDVNRFHWIGQCSDFFESKIEYFIGLGIGNCSSSSFSFFNSDFFCQNENLHYNWFQMPYTYLETGLIGLILTVFFFMMLLIVQFRIFQDCQTQQAKQHCLIAMVMSVCCLFLLVYCTALRAEEGIMAFLVLSIPFVYVGNAKAFPVKRELYD